MSTNQNLLDWDVKPVWKLWFPSELTGETSPTSVQIFGVNRADSEINRNWEKIHSVEQHNQGFKNMPDDITVTIAVKEQSNGFEVMRRLGIAAIPFDLELDIVVEGENLSTYDEGGNSVTAISNYELNDYATKHWMEGYDTYIGCIVNRESQTIDIGDIPVREFECLALRHQVKSHDQWNSGILTEGDGTHPESVFDNNDTYSL